MEYIPQKVAICTLLTVCPCLYIRKSEEIALFSFIPENLDTYKHMVHLPEIYFLFPIVLLTFFCLNNVYRSFIVLYHMQNKSFNDIYKILSEVLMSHKKTKLSSVEEVFAIDEISRNITIEILKKYN